MNGGLPEVQMPAHLHPAQRAAWLLAGQLHQRVPDGWTIVGGQMVQFHGWRRGTTPTRTTTDLDAGIAARADPGAFQTLSGSLQELGLTSVPHPTGVEHRWQRDLDPAGRVQVDLLLPSGLGECAPTSVNGSPGVQSRGVQWATQMSRDWHLIVSDHRFVVPVPSLLGAVLAKASALLNSGDPDPGRHLSDIVFLAGIATRAELLDPLTPRQAARVLEATDRIEGQSIEIDRLRLAMGRATRS